MIFKTICFILSFLGIAATGLSRKDLSKHAVKTIKTEHGAIYDCVDFYKQPAFDHPLLKNHSFHPDMRPSTTTQRITNKASWTMKGLNATEADIIPLKYGGCPRGTVPIRRTENKKLRPITTNDDISGTVFSLSQTKITPSNIIYNGVGAVISIYKPRVLTSQYSSGEIIIKGGTDTIIAGWTVNPNKYSDSETRFFAYTIAGDMHCFNSECGFVLLSSDVPLDALLKPVSVRGQQIYVNKFFIYRDPTSGNWWLQLGGIEKEPITLGFWPRKIFTGLQSSGTYAACGGEVYTIATLPPPEMGTGLFPGPFMGDDAYCTEFVVVDNTNTIVYATDTDLYTNNDAYGVMDVRSKYHTYHRFPFGGPNPN
ncbi:hypothetical protein RND81_13G039700 [Saponaria officinalis]